MIRPCAYSVLICTHNRADLLDVCLRAIIAEATAVPESGEILVIDNASVDDTRSVVKAAQHSAGPGVELRYMHQPVPGLTPTRNRGLQEAGGAIVAFLDDDAIVHRGWLRNCLYAFVAAPAAIAVGGEILPVSAVPFPIWFRPPLTKIYSVMSLEGRLDRGPSASGQFDFTHDRPSPAPGALRRYPGAEHPLGANMAFRRAVFDDRRFSPHLGRKGNDLMGGEEAEIFFALRRQGREVLYVPGMVVDHVIAAERLIEDWAVRRYRCEGVALARLSLGAGRKVLEALSMGAKLGWLAMARPFARTPFDRLLGRCRMAKSLGFFAEVVRSLSPERRQARALETTASASDQGGA